MTESPASILRLATIRILLLVLIAPGLCQSSLGQQIQVFGQQMQEFIDRPIASIRLQGLERVDPQRVRTELRTAVGDPFDPEVVRGDLRRLTRLGEFRTVTPSVEALPDGTVQIVYVFEEQDIINEIQVVGNKLISDQDLLAVVRQFPGLPRDDDLIQDAVEQMQELYRKRGNYLATVTINRPQLEEDGVLLFEVIEGPRVKVREVRFEGNEAFSDRQLYAQVKTRPSILFIRKGVLDQDLLAEDEASLFRFYKSRGYQDVRVGHRIELSPDNKEVIVTFLLNEGPQFILRSITAVSTTSPDGALKVFAPEQIAAMLEIRPGDVYREDLIEKSVRVVERAYERLGYLSDVQRRVRWQGVRSDADEPLYDLYIDVDEGNRYRVGLVNITDNFLTRDKVIRRQVRLRPGRIYDGTEVDEARRRITETRLFNDVRITVQNPDPADPEYRDLLIEIKERNTGAVNFAVAAGSDSGVFGELSLSQRNFDIADPPESLSELLRGAAFRGAGQRFNATLRPGTELFQYSMSVVEPHVLESDYSLSVAGAFRQRQFADYDEQRILGSVQVGRRLGDLWEVALRTRAEQVTLDDIDEDAPTEVFRDEGPDVLTAAGITLVRTTVGQLVRPGRGSRLELSFDRVGALGGDFDYNVISGDYTIFLTVAEDFLGRKSTLRFNTRASYIFGGGRAPTYERFYLGGRSFRGFEFRTISPKGIRNDTGLPGDDSIGGSWLFFFGGQYEFPVFQEALSMVVFADSGTVLDDVGFDDYRVSAGFGIRLAIPQLGPVPMAIDFGFPIVSEPADDERLLSFSFDIPF